jgi:hypothetical protein
MSLVRFVAGCALSTGLVVSGCSGDGPHGGAAAVDAIPNLRTVTLPPRTAEQVARRASGRHSVKLFRPRHAGATPGSPGNDDQQAKTPATPVSHLAVGGDTVELYGVSGDATSADSASNQGGPLMGAVHLQVIFWGSDWETEQTTSTTASLNDVWAAMHRILQTTYLDQMGQYGFQSIDFRGVTNVISPAPPGPTFSYIDVYNMVQDCIDAGLYPEPDDTNGDNLYFVFTPDNVDYDDPTVGGAHGTWEDVDVLDDDWNYYAFVKFGSVDALTEGFTHELVESIADPSVNVNNAWVMNQTFAGGGFEIADACENTVDRLDGQLVQAYFSQAQHACIIPFPAPPTLSTISPGQGPEKGGQSVTITGTNFDVFGTTQLLFGGKQATNVQCSSHTTCTATTPAGNGVEKVVAKVNHSSSNGSVTYLFGPAVPDCGASFACQHDGTGATTIDCGTLTDLTLQRLESGKWVQDTGAVAQTTSWIDHDDPAPGTAISFHVTATDSLGTAVTPTMTVYAMSCACTTRQVCELANGTQIFPQPKAPPNWCQLQGGHWVSKYVCP